MTRYLSAEQVLFLHSRVIAETGGEHGVRDINMLLSALGRPQATFDDQELYGDVFSKAAALMDSLVRKHPFVDGKKRTGIAAASIFLAINRYRLKVDQGEMIRFTLASAQSQLSLEDMARWFRSYSALAC